MGREVMMENDRGFGAYGPGGRQMVGNRQKKARRTNGFSLMELMLVLAIMGILMAVVAVSMGGMGDKAKIKATKASLVTIRHVLETYHLEQSAWPPDLRTLTAMKPPMLDSTQKLQDAWKTDFIYDPHGPDPSAQPYVLGSAGPNKVVGDEDDLNIWTMDVN
jgi:general secretion pathway protein G